MNSESTSNTSGEGPPRAKQPVGDAAGDAPGTVEGRVLDANGAPVAGATVAVASGTRPTRDIAAMTTANGGFRLGGLLAGTYDLEARQGTLTGRAQVVVEAGSPASAEILLGGT